MPEYTDELIEQLIGCPKSIIEPPRKEMKSEKGHLRNNMELRSDEGEKFIVFMRMNSDFPENFSIGLEYFPNDERGSICLLRFNGPHGEFDGISSPPSSHSLFHEHKAKPENIEAGLRAEKGGFITEGFASYEQALPVFMKRIGLRENEKHFPGQESLNFPVEK
ncbi:hypothetical protein KKA00_02920 [bacterium]|nr:hypothetical protein [bacterium]MBU1651147.1 hypothetical protein [bacterium]MBU1881545.1 hypothetical protein [bacterium]